MQHCGKAGLQQANVLSGSDAKGTTSLPGQVWANISRLAIVLDNVTVQAAQFVGWQSTVTSGASSETAIVGFSLGEGWTALGGGADAF